MVDVIGVDVCRHRDVRRRTNILKLIMCIGKIS